MRKASVEPLQPLLVGPKELARLLGVSVATFHRMKAAGKIGPEPIRISAGRIGWRLQTIERWLSESERAGELIDRRTWRLIEQDGQRDRGRQRKT